MLKGYNSGILDVLIDVQNVSLPSGALQAGVFLEIGIVTEIVELEL